MKKIILVFFLIYCSSVSSQNLVPNGSFEDTIELYLPNLFVGSLQYNCKDWFASGGFLPEYFHFDYNRIDSLMNRIDIYGNPIEGVPNNYYADAKFPRTGLAYAGIELILTKHYEYSDDTLLYVLDFLLLAGNIRRKSKKKTYK